MTASKAIKKEFGCRLESLMVARGLSQSELARQATKKMANGQMMSRDSVFGYVSGRNIPGALRLQALAAALDVAPGMLLPNAPEVRPPFGQRVEIRTLEDGDVLMIMEKKMKLPTAAAIMQIVQNEES